MGSFRVRVTLLVAGGLCEGLRIPGPHVYCPNAYLIDLPGGGTLYHALSLYDLLPGRS